MWSIKSILTIFIFLTFYEKSISQKHDNTWILGSWGTNPAYSIMSLTFKDSIYVKGHKDAKIDIDFSNSSISDSLGNLLFFSNGKNLYDKDFKPMKGENNINVDSIWHLSNGRIAQNTIILPYPNSKTKYAFFYLPTDLIPELCSADLSMAIVDMNKNNNLGEVLLRKKIIFKDSLENGKLTATKHANGRDWWLITQKFPKNIYYKALLTPNGTTIHDKQVIGNDFFSDVGQAVFSPDGKYYINFDLIIDSTVTSPHIMIFEFDRCTGKLSNPRSITYPFSTVWAGGIAISPNSRFLYVSYHTKLYQYDLWKKNILSSEKLIGEYDGFIYNGNLTTRFNLAELAPNGKIYISTRGATPYMHVINNPDLEGKACDFVQRGLKLPYINAWSVPNHPNYRLGALKGSPCDSLVATQDVKQEDYFKVYPNPTHDLLTIEAATSQPYQVVIRDITGRLLHQEEVNYQTQLSVADYIGGLYICEFWQNNKCISKEKIVIIH